MSPSGNAWLRFALALIATVPGTVCRAEQTGIASILIVDRHGAPLEESVEVRITGDNYDDTIVIRGHGEVTLQFGNYAITAWKSGVGVSAEVAAHIERNRVQVVLALSPRELGDYARFTPWIVSGMVSPAPHVPGKIIARLVGLYLNTVEDAVVGADGKFTLYPERIGSYRLWILIGGKIASEREIEIDFEPKLLPLIEVRLP